MSSRTYVKNTNKFWRTREKSRSALDEKRAAAPYHEKVEIARKLDSDAAFLKTGRVVSSKH